MSWHSRTSDADELVIATEAGESVARIPAELRQEIRYLCTRLDLHRDGLPTSIAVTSALSGEGSSLISAAIAAVISEDLGRHTCLIEASGVIDDASRVRRIAVKVPEQPNVNLHLAGNRSWDDLVIATRFGRLSMIRADALRVGEPADAGPAMAKLLSQLRHYFDHVVLDLPSTGSSPLAMTLAAAADASILVTRQRVTSVDRLKEAVKDLQHTRLLGVVVNDSIVHMPKVLQRRVLGG